MREGKKVFWVKNLPKFVQPPYAPLTTTVVYIVRYSTNKPYTRRRSRSSAQPLGVLIFLSTEPITSPGTGGGGGGSLSPPDRSLPAKSNYLVSLFNFYTATPEQIRFVSFENSPLNPPSFSGSHTISL